MLSMFAILIFILEHASVEMIAGPPAFETITNSPADGMVVLRMQLHNQIVLP